MTASAGTVFVSYKSEDRALVARLVEFLESRNIDVWWDQDIEPGQRWDERIKQQLSAAQCIIVIWSETSVGSGWVKDEAQFGAEAGTLLPIVIDNVKPPLGFRHFQTVSLNDWKGQLYSGQLQEVLAVISKRLDEPRAIRTTDHVPLRFSHRTSLAIAAITWLISFAIPLSVFIHAHGVSAWHAVSDWQGTKPTMAGALVEWFWLVFFTHSNYFWFTLAFMPFSVYYLARGIRTVFAQQLTRFGRAAIVMAVLLITCTLTYFDKLEGIPNLVESQPATYSVTESDGSIRARKLECAGGDSVFVFDHLLNRFAKCQPAYEKLLLGAQAEQDAANAYLIGIGMLYLYWVLFVATLGVVTFGARPWAINRAVPNVLLSGAIGFSWFVFYVPGLVSKKQLVGSDPLDAGIYLGFLIVGLFYYSWSVLAERYLTGHPDRHKINVIFWVCAFLTGALFAENASTLLNTHFLSPTMPKPVFLLLLIFLVLYFATSFFRTWLTQVDAEKSSSTTSSK